MAKNGDRSSVDLSVVNKRPPTLIMNASVIVVGVLGCEGSCGQAGAGRAAGALMPINHVRVSGLTVQ